MSQWPSLTLQEFTSDMWKRSMTLGQSSLRSIICPDMSWLLYSLMRKFPRCCNKGRVSPRHVHPDDRYGTCPAIDYTRHTLDGAACLLNSNKVSIKESSVAKLSSVCRRIYRIFSHAYFHHREIFDAYENETFLCHRFTRFVMKYYL
ncbi:hypothetical protein CRUP_013408, partial [Coryphaenoides rupestris]